MSEATRPCSPSILMRFVGALDLPCGLAECSLQPPPKQHFHLSQNSRPNHEMHGKDSDRLISLALSNMFKKLIFAFHPFSGFLLA